MDRGNPGHRVQLVLRSHYRLRDKPVRTLEALRIFLRDEANVVFDALRAGRDVVVRVGHRAEVEMLALSMQAQGFVVEVGPEDPAQASAP